MDEQMLLDRGLSEPEFVPMWGLYQGESDEEEG